MALGYGLTALGNSSRRNAAQLAAAQCWREIQTARALITDRRLICQIGGRWLSFYFSAVTAYYPEPANWSLVLDFDATSPLRVGGANAPLAAVVAVWAIQGRAAVRQHPALASLTGAQS